MIPAGLFLVDTSALARVAYAPIADRLRDLGVRGLLASCPMIDLEVLYSARSPAEYIAIDTRRHDAFTELPLRAEIGTRAREVQAQLARLSRHRAAGVIDLLSAATAEYYGATVLHYDADFDHIAQVTSQPTEWIAPAGSAT